jgi:aryl-alcohol dehydrogenase-like predicted oxidoreductase
MPSSERSDSDSGSGTPEGPESFERTVLGRTGLEVGRLGVASSYGVPARALERAFERGVNYFYWGTYRRAAFGQGLRNLAQHRERLVMVVQSYSRVAGLVGWSVERALRELRFDYADVLLLGMWQRPPWPGVLEAARKLRERGLVRFLALSTHRRPVVPQLAQDPDFAVFHIRYSAVHTGAEADVFPHLSSENRPGIVAYTATSWRRLLGHRRIPRSEKAPTAGDCYRFVLTNPAVDVCMTGPSDAAQMEHALEALGRGPMSEEELAWMRRVGRAIYRRKESGGRRES